MTRKAKRGASIGHNFGGDWTETKLAVVAKYLTAYTRALKNTTFEKLYIDAFAGTGYRQARRDGTGPGPGSPLPLPDLAGAEPQRLLEGSARRALRTDPGFDRYVFIERDADRCAQLETLRSEIPALAGAIQICQGEANAEIQGLCREDWPTRRAVLFLDPYGMQVQWATIEAVAGTHAIDLWILFPLGVGVNRLLTKSNGRKRGSHRSHPAAIATAKQSEFATRPDRTPYAGPALPSSHLSASALWEEVAPRSGRTSEHSPFELPSGSGSGSDSNRGAGRLSPGGSLTYRVPMSGFTSSLPPP